MDVAFLEINFTNNSVKGSVINKQFLNHKVLLTFFKCTTFATVLEIIGSNIHRLINFNP